jgi:hypothetical protein
VSAHGVVMWLPTVVTAAASVAVLAGVLRAGIGRRRGEDDTDGESDGGGGGGGGRRRPPPQAPPGGGPVDWPEFERQFAEFVARGRRPPAPARERRRERRPEKVGAATGR